MQTITEKLEIAKYNIEQEIKTLTDTAEALADFKRVDFKSKWLTNHLEKKGVTAYYRGDYSDCLKIQYVTKEYRQSWNDNNESYYGVFDRTLWLDCYFTNIETVADLQVRLLDWVETRSKNLASVTEAIKNIDAMTADIAKRTAIIAENQKELDAMDYHVRVAFGLTKN